jgi:hypothetical protein
MGEHSFSVSSVSVLVLSLDITDRSKGHSKTRGEIERAEVELRTGAAVLVSAWGLEC